MSELGLRIRCQRCGAQMELRDPVSVETWRPDQFWVCPTCGRHFWTTYPPPKPAASPASAPAPAAPGAKILKLAYSMQKTGGTGQAFEALLLRMRAHPLPEARSYADLMLTELRKVIPSFLTRVERPDRGGAWSRYLEDTREQTATVARRILADVDPEPRPGVTLVDFDPDAEDKLLAAICYPLTNLPERQLLERVRTLDPPAEHPMIVTLSGSPPKLAILAFTHLSAMI